VELKLLVAPGDLARIAGLPLVGEGAVAPPSPCRQHTTYYDAPGLILARRGLALRIRREGVLRIQAVKTMGGAAGDAAAVAVRQEWEWEIAGDGPDLAPLRRGELATVIPGEVVDALTPIFTTDIKRTAVTLRTATGALIELALDEGRITARHPGGGSAHAAVAEIELELKDGRLADLFDLARAIHARVPLRLATRSKADMGFGLLTGRVPESRPARPLGLSPVSTVAEAFRHIARNGLTQLLDNEPALAAGGDAEALREMAAAIRRLDAAFGLFKGVIGGPRAMGLRTELRRLGAPLEEARLWERVHDRWLAPLMHDDRAPRHLAAAVAGARRTARIAALEHLAGPAWTGWQLDFAAWLEGGDWLAEAVDGTESATGVFARPMTDLAPTLLADRLQRVARAMRKGPAADGAEGPGKDADWPRQWRPLWRRTQRLRYALDFCRAVFPPDRVRPLHGAVETFRRTLKQAADADQALDALKALAADGNAEMARDLRRVKRHLKATRDEARSALSPAWEALTTIARTSFADPGSPGFRPTIPPP
jgi:inorganic triphosphatase YgiF